MPIQKSPSAFRRARHHMRRSTSDPQRTAARMPTGIRRAHSRHGHRELDGGGQPLGDGVEGRALVDERARGRRGRRLPT
jgi:hypothetical protein